MLIYASPSQAALPAVERHDLQCGDLFPCPEAIQRRVDFWVQVFRQWDTGQRVIHDSDNPEKVFSVLRTEDRCSAKRPGRAVKREQDKIRMALRKAANRLDNNQAFDNSLQQELADLYGGRAGEIRAAANRIRCQAGNQDRFEKALQRFGEYQGFVLEYLEQAGLSTELQYLPFVESAYHPKAYSHLGAAGMWQIMPRTARNLGLQISASVDERFDPKLATQGAIRYFQDSVRRLTETAHKVGSPITPGRLNPFVITSYNYGVRGMTRAVEQVGLDYVRLLDEYKSRTFRTAVRNFYASFLAARYVAKNSERYFPGVVANRERQASTVVTPHTVSAKTIQNVFKVSRKQLEALNPALTSRVWRGFAYIPAGYALQLPHRTDGWQAQGEQLAALPAEGPSDGGQRHVVARGDTACEIAELWRVRCRDLIELNRLGRRATIRIGQTLKIPGKGVSRPVQVAAGPGGTHVVRAGQTPCGIANSYRINCQALLAANGLSMRSKIYVGQSLLVPGADNIVSTGNHTVRRGQTPCGIARSYGVSCNQLLAFNGLNTRSVIYVGQTLDIPGAGETSRKTVPPSGEHVVSRGETPCVIAERYGLGCTALLSANGLTRSSTIYVGQKLKLPGVGTPAVTVAQVDQATPAAPEKQPKPAYTGSTSDGWTFNEEGKTDAETPQATVVVEADQTPAAVEPAEEQAAQVQASADSALAPLYDWSDLKVSVSGDEYTVLVLPEENLGYFADWLGIGRAGALRSLNGLRFGQVLPIGKRLKLPVANDDQLRTFEARRREFHSLLVDEYVQRYDIDSVQSYVVQSGDTLWGISNDFDVPLWVLYRFNLGFLDASVGARVNVPEVSSKLGSVR